ANGLGDLDRRTEEACRPSDIGKGFIYGEPLDQRREVTQHLHRAVAETLVLLEVPADEAQVWAQLAGPPSRHAAAHAGGFGLVGRGEHTPAADSDRPAAQRRVAELFDRGIEGIEVRMEDRGRPVTAH